MIWTTLHRRLLKRFRGRLKDWFRYHWKHIAWGFGILILAVVIAFIEGSLDNSDAEYLKVRKYCLELVSKFEGIKLDPKEAISVPIGVRAKQASYVGTMMVWEKEISGISVKCSIVSQGNEVKFLAVNGEDKTGLARREEREE